MRTIWSIPKNVNDGVQRQQVLCKLKKNFFVAVSITARNDRGDGSGPGISHGLDSRSRYLGLAEILSASQQKALSSAWDDLKIVPDMATLIGTRSRWRPQGAKTVGHLSAGPSSSLKLAPENIKRRDTRYGTRCESFGTLTREIPLDCALTQRYASTGVAASRESDSTNGNLRSNRFLSVS